MQDERPNGTRGQLDGLDGPLPWSPLAAFTNTVVSEGSSPATWLLGLGAVSGLAFALWTVVTPGPKAGGQRVAPDAVAMVNGQPIPQHRLTAGLSRIPPNQRSQPDAHERVLKHLVDEELLVQRGEALGLHRTHPNVRRALIRAAVALEKGAGQQPPIPEADLQLFYNEVRADFERPAKVHVRQVRVSADDPESNAQARAIARRAASMLRMGMDYDHVCRVAGCEVDPAVPDAPVPVPDLEAVLGERVVQKLLAASPGSVLGVLSRGRTHRVLLLQAVLDGQTPTLDDVRQEVEARYHHEQQLGEREESLAAMRERALVITGRQP